MADQPVSQTDASPSRAYSSLVLERTVSGAGAISIEDFELKILSLQADLAAKDKTHTHPKHNSKANSPNEPIPIQKGPASDAIQKLFEACQSHLIPTPQYTYTEIHTGQFKVKMTVAGKSFEEFGPFSSKREAKQVISKKGYELVMSMPQPLVAKENPPSDENYIGLIYEFVMATEKSSPDFQEFRIGTQYSCELTLPSHAGIIFGSRTRALPSKKAARNAAARDAVVWLREDKRIPATDEFISKSPNTSMRSDDVASPTENSYIQQVEKLCQMLGISSPRYDLKPLESDFYHCTAHFENWPGIEPPICEVRNIFGKKSAKRECARAVVEYFRDRRTKNEALARRGPV